VSSVDVYGWFGCSGKLGEAAFVLRSCNQLAVLAKWQGETSQRIKALKEVNNLVLSIVSSACEAVVRVLPSSGVGGVGVGGKKVRSLRSHKFIQVAGQTLIAQLSR
jgi:hypothetical protein